MAVFFFFNDTATTEIYTLSLHDALPIWGPGVTCSVQVSTRSVPDGGGTYAGATTTPRSSRQTRREDRKSTRLNSSHANISYAVFCLKKKAAHARIPSETTNHEGTHHTPC